MLLVLFAQNKAAGSPFDRPELIWGSVGLAGALFVGAVVIYLVDKWRRQAALDEKKSGEELTDFRAMFERGEITEAEYNALRLKVAQRVKKAEPAAPAPPANPAVPGPFPPEYFEDPHAGPSANGTPPDGQPRPS
jgi:hypothetical protein